MIIVIDCECVIVNDYIKVTYSLHVHHPTTCLPLLFFFIVLFILIGAMLFILLCTTLK